MADQPSVPVDDEHHAKQEVGHGAKPAKVIGKGLGGVVILAGVVILFGPFLLAPLTLAVRTWRASPGDSSWMPWVLALAVGLGVVGAQFLFAIQRNPLVRTLTVALFSFIFALGAWLFFTRDGGTEPSFALPPPWWERLGQTGWIVVGAATLIYSAAYLWLLHRLDDRPWARRLQLFGGGRREAAPAAEPSLHSADPSPP